MTYNEYKACLIPGNTINAKLALSILDSYTEGIKVIDSISKSFEILKVYPHVVKLRATHHGKRLIGMANIKDLWMRGSLYNVLAMEDHDES